MKALMTMFSALGVLFMVLNSLGGIVSGIWLAVLGEWWAIGLGILNVLFSTFIISIALIPSIPLAAGALTFGRRSKVALFAFGLLSSLYVVAVMTAWCVGVLYVFASQADSSSWIPLLLWSYGIATGPWSYMAAKEAQGGGGEGSIAAAFFAQVAYLAMVVVGVVAGASMITLTKIFVGVMLVNVAIQMVIAVASAGDFQIESGGVPPRAI